MSIRRFSFWDDEHDPEFGRRRKRLFSPGDRVRICEGTLESFIGEVADMDAVTGKVTVVIEVFGRKTPVELESWQLEHEY